MAESRARALSGRLKLARRLGGKRAIYWIISGAIDKLHLKRWIQLSLVELFTASISQLPKNSRVPKAFGLRFAGHQDIPAIQAFFAKPEQVLSRSQKGDRCLLLDCENEVKAAEWIVIGPNEYCEDAEELGCVFRFPVRTSWLFDGAGTVPGTWGMLMRALPKELEKEGIESAYLRVDSSNIASLDSHRSLGYARAGILCHLRVGGFAITLVRSERGSWRRLPVQLGELELVADK